MKQGLVLLPPERMSVQICFIPEIPDLDRLSEAVFFRCAIFRTSQKYNGDDGRRKRTGNAERDEEDGRFDLVSVCSGGYGCAGAGYFLFKMAVEYFVFVLRRFIAELMDLN